MYQALFSEFYPYHFIFVSWQPTESTCNAFHVFSKRKPDLKNKNLSGFSGIQSSWTDYQHTYIPWVTDGLQNNGLELLTKDPD